MTAYQNYTGSEVMPVTLPSGVAGAGYGFSIRGENNRALSRCRSRRGKTPNRREPRSRVPSKRLLRSRRRVRRIAALLAAAGDGVVAPFPASTATASQRATVGGPSPLRPWTAGGAKMTPDQIAEAQRLTREW